RAQHRSRPDRLTWSGGTSTATATAVAIAIAIAVPVSVATAAPVPLTLRLDAAAAESVPGTAQPVDEGNRDRLRHGGSVDAVHPHLRTAVGGGVAGPGGHHPVGRVRH